MPSIYKKVRTSKTETRDEHRILMEEHLGRKLTFNEIVHHIDGDKRNNSLENLELMSRADHIKHHKIKRGPISIAEREKLSEQNSRSNHPRSKITEEMALQIKEMMTQGWRNVDIAKRFNLSRPIISQIRHGHRWV